MPRRNPTYYSVNPTFTAGSPAQVDPATARRVAEEEKQGHERSCSGIYGEATAAGARLRETAGIAYAWTEKGKGAVVEDLITGESRTFRKFEEFQKWGADMRMCTKVFQGIIERPADEQEAINAEVCRACGERYDEHDGREHHRFERSGRYTWRRSVASV